MANTMNLIGIDTGFDEAGKVTDFAASMGTIINSNMDKYLIVGSNLVNADLLAISRSSNFTSSTNMLSNALYPQIKQIATFIHGAQQIDVDTAFDLSGFSLFDINYSYPDPSGPGGFLHQRWAGEMTAEQHPMIKAAHALNPDVDIADIAKITNPEEIFDSYFNEAFTSIFAMAEDKPTSSEFGSKGMSSLANMYGYFAGDIEFDDGPNAKVGPIGLAHHHQTQFDAEAVSKVANQMILQRENAASPEQVAGLLTSKAIERFGHQDITASVELQERLYGGALAFAQDRMGVGATTIAGAAAAAAPTINVASAATQAATPPINPQPIPTASASAASSGAKAATNIGANAPPSGGGAAKKATSVAAKVARKGVLGKISPLAIGGVAVAAIMGMAIASDLARGDAINAARRSPTTPPIDSTKVAMAMALGGGV